MTEFPIIGSQVALSTSAAQPTDSYCNGVLVSTSGMARASTSAFTTTSNGLPFTSAGVLSYVDATAGLPAGTQYCNGIPISGAGAICTSTDVAATWSNGLPFALNGAVSAIVSSLDLNFLDGTLDSRVTFARADATTCATYFGSDGLLKTAAANVPRFDYDPSTLQARGLLIEESRTNLLLQSRDMTQAAWSKTDVTPTRNQVGIDGVANTACLITEGSAGTAATLQTGAAATAGSTITGSIVAKRGNTDWVRFGIRENSGIDGGNAWFNLNTGAKGSTSAAGAGTSVSSTITSLGGGWYRCTITCVPNGTYTLAYPFISSASADNSTTRVNGATYIVDCAQLEVGAFATSIITTTAATVTRAADSASMTGTNFSSWFNASAGTFVADFVSGNYSAASMALLAVTDGTANNRFLLYRNTTSGVNFASYVAGVGDFTPFTTPALTGKIAAAYTSADKHISYNGASVVSNSVATPVGLNRLDIGNATGGSALNGYIRRISYYPTRLANATLQALTT